MNENLDLIKILKDCPEGTKLYSTIYGDVYFKGIKTVSKYPILLTRSDGFSSSVTSKGEYMIEFNGECTLFPSKDQRDWSKWHIPFKDGDIVTDKENKYYSKMEEKIRTWQKIFDDIKANGYKWNAETKTLEKLIISKFKVGDVIQDKDGYKVKITEVNAEDECYEYKSIIAKGIGGIAFSEQNDWELIPDKFDPNTLIPFESKVLVRDGDQYSWVGSIYTHHKENGFYTVNGTYYCQCIPYNDDTAHLIGTYKKASNYYRYWEK